MFKWLKSVFGFEKSKNKRSSNGTTICFNSGREEVVEWEDQGIQDILVQENARTRDNEDILSWIPLSTPSVLPPFSIPTVTRFSLPEPPSPPSSPQTSPPPFLIRNSPLRQSPLPSASPVIRISPLRQSSLSSVSPPPPLSGKQNSPLRQSPLSPLPLPRKQNSSSKQSPLSPLPLPRKQDSSLKQTPLPSVSPPPTVLKHFPSKQSPLPPPSLLPSSTSKQSPPCAPPTTSPNTMHTDRNASLRIGQSLKVKAPSTDLPHASVKPQPLSKNKLSSASSNAKTRLLPGTQAATRTSNKVQTLLEVSEDKKPSFSKAGVSKVTPKHGILPACEIKDCLTEQKMEGGKVMDSKIHQKSYPRCLLPTTLINHPGELITVNGTRYVQIKSKEEVLMVSLNTGAKGEAPCRVVWQSGKPVPLVELCDNTCVNIDAFLSPGSERMQAMVVWQKEKPDTCLQLLDNTYIFLNGRALTCERKSLNISAKRLNITFDGKQVSAEVCNVVAFKENKVITMAKFLELCETTFYASVFKMLAGTGHGRVVYVCTCLWIGKRPVIENMPMKITRENVYRKISYGLYSFSANTRILYCDLNASLNLAKRGATIEVEIDGSCKSLEATHLLDLKLAKLKHHAPVQVRAHVMKEVCGGRENWSAVMIHLSDSTGTDASLTRVARGHAVPNINKGSALQNTSVSSLRKDDTLNREGTNISPIQGTGILAAPKTSVPTGQKASVQSVPNPTIPIGKTQPKNAGLSHSSLSTNTQENNAWKTKKPKTEYLTCSVMASKPNAAVAAGCGKAILVTRNILFVDQEKCSASANLHSLLKKYQNLGVIFTESREAFTDMNITMKHVALVAWAGKKPNNANAIVQSQLSAIDLVLHDFIQVEASCRIKSVQNNKATLLVCSKYLPNGKGIVHTELGNILKDETPITLTSAMKLKYQSWNCELRIEDGGKQLKVPLAWRGRKPATGALPRTSTGQPRQSPSTDDLSGTLNGHRLIPSPSSYKVMAGVVIEVLPEGGRVKAEDGRLFTFSIDACFLFDLCLHQMKAREVLVVGMKVEIEVTCSGGSETLQRIWLAGRGVTLSSSFSFSNPKLNSWCNMNGISPDTQRILMKEAELLSPNLFPTAASAEATMIVDISA